jgi:putative hydrolase of the HAD superfamily
MTFLYDIGRVLLDFHFEPSLATLLPPGTRDPKERLSRLLARKDEFESGGVSAEEYIEWAIGVLESPVTPDQFRHAWRHIFTINEPMWRVVRRLRADGHRLILFSNTNSIHCPWIFEAYPEFSLFDEAVLSFEAKSIKPHPEIYQFAINRYTLNASETLYIDDLPENIATGERFGFRCFQYQLHDHAAFERWLDAELKL